MEQANNRNLLKGSLSITGSSEVTGGVYDQVQIVGEGTIDGDVACRKLKCVGTLDLNGSLQTRRANIVGTCSFTDYVQADDLIIAGTVMVGGNAALRELNCSGSMDVQGSLTGDQLNLKGELYTRGDCEAERFSARGIFDIGGLLNAGQLDIKLYRDCRAGEIGGGRIRIRKASLLNPLSFFFRPAAYALLSTSTIEGDDIYLEYTKADVVRGSKVVLGPGCEIGLVEYKERFELKNGAANVQNRKI
jgi:cytoskeletal protein CcmA (bactofilin family)